MTAATLAMELGDEPLFSDEPDSAEDAPRAPFLPMVADIGLLYTSR